MRVGSAGSRYSDARLCVACAAINTDCMPRYYAAVQSSPLNRRYTEEIIIITRDDEFDR